MIALGRCVRIHRGLVLCCSALVSRAGVRGLKQLRWLHRALGTASSHRRASLAPSAALLRDHVSPARSLLLACTCGFASLADVPSRVGLQPEHRGLEHGERVGHVFRTLLAVRKPAGGLP
jgi:hypothetical protein